MNQDNFDRMIMDVGNEMSVLLFCHLGETAMRSAMFGREAMKQVKDVCEPLNNLIVEALRGGR